jgi:hypothetical protein
MDAPNRLLADPSRGAFPGENVALFPGEVNRAGEPPNDPAEEAPDDNSDDDLADGPPPPPVPGNAPNGVTTLDRKLAATAYKKTLEGKELTSREQSVLKRFEKEKEERLRWQYYRSIPQKHWRQMSGRQTKVLQEQALAYGIPFSGATIDLTAVARGLHDFLADNAQKLARDDDDLMQGSASPALERYREERAALARLDRLERERKLMRRDEVRESLGRIAAMLRSAGDTLQRQYGQGAADVLLEALDDAAREIERSFGTAEAASDQPDQPDASAD